MTDLVAFLNARYNDAEELATQAARTHGPVWVARSSAAGYVIEGTVEHRVSSGAPETDLWDSEGGYLSTTQAAAEHIGANDPAVVLRDIAAKRNVIRWADAAEGAYGEDPFYVLQCLAEAYANHPDFDPAWTVEQ